MDDNLRLPGGNGQGSSGHRGPPVYDGFADHESSYGPAGFSVGRTLSTIWRFRYFVLSVVIVSVAIGLYQSQVRRQEYRSNAVVYISPDQDSPLAGLGGGVARMLGGAGGGGLRSHVELIRSMAVLTDVVDRTGLQLMEREEGLIWDEYYPSPLIQNPRVAGEPSVSLLELRFAATEVIVRAGAQEVRAPYGSRVEIGGVSFTVDSRPPVEEAEIFVLTRFQAADQLAANLDVRIRTDTQILDLLYSTYDPIIAQRVANAVVESFSAFDNSRERGEAQRRGEFLTHQIAYTDSLLREAQSDLIAFQRNSNVQSSAERFAAQQTGLMELELRRSEMDSERRLYVSLIRELNDPRSDNGEDRIGVFLSAPMITDNAVFEALVERLMEYEADRDRMVAGSWGSAQSSPDVTRVESLITATEARLVDALGSYVVALDARIAALDELHTRTAASMQGLPSADAAELRFEHQIEAITDVLSYLQQGYHMARVEEAVGSGRVEVVDLARPGAAFGADPIRSMAFALIFGLMLGTGGALVLANLSSSIQQRDEVEKVLHISRLGVIPSFSEPNTGARLLGRLQNGANGRSSANGRPGQALIGENGDSQRAEAFRALRTNLIFGRGLGNFRTIAITSACPGEGRSSTVANLGAALAEQGRRVLVVDCDLRHPQLQDTFGVPMEQGLSDLILGTALIDEVVHPSKVPGLFVLPAGPFSPQAVHLLGTAWIGEALERLKADYDVVLLDTPALQVTADGAVVAAHADATVFLVRAGKTDRRLAQSSLQQLQAVGANVVGGVLTDANEGPATAPSSGKSTVSRAG